MVDAVPDLGPGSRAMDLGCGTGCLIPHLQARGVQDILAVDLSSEMLDEVQSVPTFRIVTTSSQIEMLPNELARVDGRECHVGILVRRAGNGSWHPGCCPFYCVPVTAMCTVCASAVAASM